MPKRSAMPGNRDRFEDNTERDYDETDELSTDDMELEKAEEEDFDIAD